MIALVKMFINLSQMYLKELQNKKTKVSVGNILYSVPYTIADVIMHSYAN